MYAAARVGRGAGQEEAVDGGVGAAQPGDRAEEELLVRGRRAPIVGSVCMDMTTIDVTGMDVAPGDEVVMVGEQDSESIGVREIAASIGTIPYELLCRLGSRIERVYQ